MAAAVSEFTPTYPQQGKLTKSPLGAAWSLELKETEDILSTLNKDGIYTIAFKAEMDSEKGLTHARELLEKKEVDAVCYNLLRDSESFGTDDNEITLICKERELSLGRSDKLSLAFNILNRLKDLEK
jgi:phosphopantothenoylcysteine decarboxylase/phosphopantothenate--cysteine ligase